jgi:hypothetical protein
MDAAPPAGTPRDLPRITFADPHHPQRFSEIYLPDPPANFASLNAGDYLLHVGGGGINREFRVTLEACGQHPEHKYERLHQELLRGASRTPGKLYWLQRPSQAETNASDDWLLEDTVAFCGLVPPGSRMAKLSPVGLISIAVFPEDRRPKGSAKNVAMVYVVGPNCGSAVSRGQREVDEMSAQDFLEVVDAIGNAITDAVVQYNTAAEPTLRTSLPQIEMVRVCLLSGGVFRHPDASKLQLAKSFVTGLLRGGTPWDGSRTTVPTLDFAWDADVFRTAYKALGHPDTAAAASDTTPTPDGTAPTGAVAVPRRDRKRPRPPPAHPTHGGSGEGGGGTGRADRGPCLAREPIPGR